MDVFTSKQELGRLATMHRCSDLWLRIGNCRCCTSRLSRIRVGGCVLQLNVGDVQVLEAVVTYSN